MTQSTQLSASFRAEEGSFGSVVLPDGNVSFRIWAPSAHSVSLRLYLDNRESTEQMKSEGAGWYSLVSDKAEAGSLYNYLIDDKILVPDSASRFQPKGVHGPSMVVDRSHFKWNPDWKGRPWEETVLYELHVGTFSPEGTFAGVTKKLDYLCELGVTAIELMPIADFPGNRGWGYDGVLLFAPHGSYGTPEDLRTLINTAHEKGMMVFLDLVYNHFGPEGNYLHVYAKQFFTEKHKTPWGAAINFDAEGSDVVRQFYVSNVLYWLNQFRFDGIRFDAVHAIRDDSKTHILEEIAQAVHDGPARERFIHLVLENDDNDASLLERQHGKPKYYDAQWNDDVHHAMHVIATGEVSGYYADYAETTSHNSAAGHLARCLTEGFAYQADSSPLRAGEKRGESSKHLPPVAFVSFMQNHDQIGNRAFGDRIATLASKEAEHALSAVLLLSPNIPMLYMGQEWGSKTPFCYFCDLGADLAPLVTEGRRNEFAKFPEFQNPSMRNQIPDPVAPETFERSKLIWADLHSAEHNQHLEFCRELLSIRKRCIVSLLSASEVRAQVIEQREHLILAEWNFQGLGILYLAANLGGNAAESQKGKSLSGTTAIFESSIGRLPEIINGCVPPWTVVWASRND